MESFSQNDHVRNVHVKYTDGVAAFLNGGLVIPLKEIRLRLVTSCPEEICVSFRIMSTNDSTMPYSSVDNYGDRSQNNALHGLSNMCDRLCPPQAKNTFVIYNSSVL